MKKKYQAMQEKRRMPGRPVRRIVQKFCGGRIDFVHEIEYNKFELIFIYHSLYNLQDVSGKQKRTKRTAEQKNGDRGGYIMEIPFRTELTTSTIITMTIITREKTADMPAMHAVPKKNARTRILPF